MNSLASRFRAQKKSAQKLATLTAYDYPTSRLLDGLSLDFLLVGDSLGMVILGYPDTTSVTMEHMEHHTAAVARGATQTPVVADLPIHSIDTPESAVRNARRLMAAGAAAVKVEGGHDVLSSIQAISEDGIPLVGHLGMLPQRIQEEGKYRIKGRTPEQAESLQADAVMLDDSGVAAIVLELVSPPLARQISQSISAPTIGIGSGPDCDGQVLVTHDLLGLFPWFTPGFVQPKARLADEIERAVTEYVSEVRGAADPRHP